jgi:hypothetical protein
MNDSLITRVAGVSALLATAVQFAAIGVALSHGIVPGGPVDFGDGAQVAAANTNHAANVLGLSLATLAPSLLLPLGLGLYVMLKRARAYALFGLVMYYVGMSVALVHEVLRVVLFARLPPAYAAASEEAKPTILVLGDVLSHAEALFDLIGFVVLLGLSLSSFALAIISLRTVPRWLGWLLLVPAIGVGLICFPLAFAGVAAAEMLILPGMLVFTVWSIAIGLALIRWKPRVELAAPAAEVTRS